MIPDWSLPFSGCGELRLQDRRRDEAVRETLARLGGGGSRGGRVNPMACYQCRSAKGKDGCSKDPRPKATAGPRIWSQTAVTIGSGSGAANSNDDAHPCRYEVELAAWPSDMKIRFAFPNYRDTLGDEA